MNEEAIAPASRLSERQRECLRLVLQGYQSDKDIGLKLRISPQTVKNHIASARKTLGVPSRGQAARVLADFERRQGPLHPSEEGTVYLIEHSPDGTSPSQTLAEPAPSSDQVVSAAGPQTSLAAALARIGTLMRTARDHLGGSRRDLSVYETLISVLRVSLITSVAGAVMIAAYYWLNLLDR